MDSVSAAPGSKMARAALLAGIAVLAILTAVEAAGASKAWAFSWSRELSVALIILFAAWSAGRAVLRAVLGPAHCRGLIVAVAIGLGLLATATFVAGVAGLLHPVTLGLLVAAASAPAIAHGLASRRTAPQAAPAPAEVESGNTEAPSPWPAWPGRVVAVAVLGCGFLYASLPPIFYDTLVYHFGLPGLYLATGSLTYWNGNYLACYPQNSEMLDVIAMAFGGEKAAQVLGFGIACLVALKLRRMGRREAGTAGADLVFLFLVSQWPFWFGACFGKNDLTGALFILAAIALALDVPRERPYRALAVAGALAGFGVGVKLTNALPALLLGLAPLLERGLPLKDKIRRPAVFLFAVFLAASPWLVRNTIYRGNPLFPAFYSVFGGRDFSPTVAKRMEYDTLQVLDRSPISVAKRLGRIGFDRDGYASGGELSPLTMPLLIAGIALARRRRSLVPLAISFVTLAVGVGYLSAVLRTYAVAWVLVPFAAAVAFTRFRSKPWRIAVAAIVLVAAVPGFQFSARMLETVSARGSRVFLGRIAPDKYLADQVNYFSIAQYANTHLPADARILVVGSARAAYLRRRADAPSAQDDAWIAKASRPGADPRALRDELRALGYTHILLNAKELGGSVLAQQATGIRNDREATERLNKFFQSLQLVISDNGCVLFNIGGA